MSDLSRRSFTRSIGDMDMRTQDELTRLPASERIALIAMLWNSLDNEQLALTAAQQAELDKRLETLEDDRRQGTPWGDVKEEMERRG